MDVPNDLRPSQKHGTFDAATRRNEELDRLHVAAQRRGERYRHDERLAGYLTLRSALGRHVDTWQSRSLVHANQSMSEVRELLPHGRPNVIEDTSAANDQSRSRAIAARRLLVGKNHLPAASLETRAKCALWAGAGGCNDYAVLVYLLHGERLAYRSQSLHIVQDPPRKNDHVWVELRNRNAPNSAIVLDAWSNSPAIYIADANRKLISDPARETGIPAFYDRPPPLQKPVLEFIDAQVKLRESPAFRSAFEDLVNGVSAVGERSRYRLHSKPNAIDPTFRQNALAAIAAIPEARRAIIVEILRAGAVQTAGANCRQAARLASRPLEQSVL